MKMNASLMCKLTVCTIQANLLKSPLIDFPTVQTKFIFKRHVPAAMILINHREIVRVKITLSSLFDISVN